MRINPKLYPVAEEVAPFETQEFDGRKIELFYMDDFEGVKEEFIGKGQFATWSSIDGVNYRVFFEQGYYGVVKALYTPEINKIWTDFWDTTEKISKKFTRYILLPIMGVSVAMCLCSSFMGSYGQYIAIGFLVLAFIAMLVCNTLTKKKITQENINSREKIVNQIGKDEFDALLGRQKEYMDSYYENLYPTPEEDEEASEEEKNEDTPEATVIDAEVTEVEEVKEEEKDAE